MAAAQEAPIAGPDPSQRQGENANGEKEPGSAPLLAGGETEEGKVLAVDQRFRSPGLLIFGASCAMLGFVLITVIGVIDYRAQRKNTYLNVPYNSKKGYWPSTVSEMVHNHESPGGKLFYTFGMIAGVCIFTSHYPFNLRNVYTGHETVPILNCYWTTFRQICPSMGLWLLIGVNTYPLTIALASQGLTKLFCVFLHLTGAGMMFVGYMCCEVKCLGILGFKEGHGGKFLRIEGRERNTRRNLAYLIVVGFAGFSLMQFIIVFAKKIGICCPDEWVLKGESILDAEGRNRTIDGPPQITNTATGLFFWLKVLSFVFEDVAGLSLVFSHVAIWYYCEERFVDFGTQELTEVFRQED